MAAACVRGPAQLGDAVLVLGRSAQRPGAAGHEAKDGAFTPGGAGARETGPAGGWLDKACTHCSAESPGHASAKLHPPGDKRVVFPLKGEVGCAHATSPV